MSFLLAGRAMRVPRPMRSCLIVSRGSDEALGWGNILGGVIGVFPDASVRRAIGP